MTRGEGEQAQRLRELCLSLPEVSERLSHGEPTWFVRGKRAMVMLAEHHHDDRLAFWCAAPQGVQGSLVSAAPSRYFVPPYVGTRGWLGVYLDLAERAEGDPDWSAIEAHVQDAYRLVAPLTLVRRLAAGQPS